MHFKLKPRKHGRGAYADKPFRFVSIEKAKEAISQFYDQHLKGTEGVQNPATRPLVKSLGVVSSPVTSLPVTVGIRVI